MGLLEIGIMMVAMSVSAAFGSAILFLNTKEKTAYREWKLNPAPPTVSGLSSGKFPLNYMLGYLFRFLSVVGVICVVVSIFLR